jgi:5-methylcytosine-specific restriction protein A
LTCIITWNKDKWPEAKMQDLMDRFAAGEKVIERWKCGSYKKFGIGDRVFLSRTGKLFPGLLGAGRIASEARREPDFEDPGKEAWYVDVRFDYLSSSPTTVVASHEDLAQRLDTSPRAFTPQKSGHPFPGNDDELEALWSKLIGRSEVIYPDEISTEDDIQYIEGLKKSITVNKYERDKEARLKCIEVHGTTCKACGINLGVVYGPELGKRYIHIHHLIPLKDIGGEYRVDPVKDLIPLCPNCHSMVHQIDPPLAVEELRSKILPRYLSLFN